MSKKYIKRLITSYVRDPEAPFLTLGPYMKPAEVAEAFRFLAAKDREEFVALHLDKGNQPLCWDRVSIGSISETLVSAREVVKAALLSNASSIILLHQHPSERVNPSTEDFTMTRKIKDLASQFEIKVLDHIIIGGENYYSFNENGVL